MKCTPVKFGDVAYELSIYPGYQIQMILWEGDDEFPPSSQILFSDNFPVSFAAEDMAVMGRCDHWLFEGFSESSERAVKLL